MTTVVRVLLVDDQMPFLGAMTAVVEETDGFEVVGDASSGEESLLAVAELLPDLVLMDVNLPGIDGLEATRRLKQCPCLAGNGGELLRLLARANGRGPHDEIRALQEPDPLSHPDIEF